MIPVATSVATRSSNSAREENAWGVPVIGNRSKSSVR